MGQLKKFKTESRFPRKLEIRATTGHTGQLFVENKG
jgi:hypothetical protein